VEYQGLRDFIDVVEGLGELRVARGAAAHLEVGAISELAQRRSDSPAVLFDDVQGYPSGYRVFVNSLGSASRMALALGLPTGPVTAVLLAALMVHAVPPGPTLVTDHPDVFWGFVASMYVGNLMLLALNLPLVGIFVNVLRIPYSYLYPLVIMFCIIGVYQVSNSIVDVWIMLIMGVVGYGFRKFGFDPAPMVLALVISPTFEMSLRQSLIMSNGNWTIFVERPIALGLILVALGLLSFAALTLIRQRKDWRARLAEAEAGDAA